MDGWTVEVHSSRIKAHPGTPCLRSLNTSKPFFYCMNSHLSVFMWQLCSLSISKTPFLKHFSPVYFVICVLDLHLEYMQNHEHHIQVISLQYVLSCVASWSIFYNMHKCKNDMKSTFFWKFSHLSLLKFLVWLLD